MKRTLTGICAATLASATFAQTVASNLAMNAPDQQAWQLFVLVNTKASGSNATFETWASDTDTFNASPAFPQAASPRRLRAPAGGAAGRLSIQESGGLLPAVPPNPNIGEETRRNKVAFDFIVQNSLHKMSGLKA